MMFDVEFKFKGEDDVSMPYVVVVDARNSADARRKGMDLIQKRDAVPKSLIKIVGLLKHRYR